jgi:glycosyltransferase involved in cell wall biosynthesis
VIGTAAETPRRVLAVIGDAEELATWSNTPFFFLRAGRRLKFLDRGLRLLPRHLRWHRRFWNARRWLAGHGCGGFQYSSAFLERLYAQDRASDGAEILSHFPLLPPGRADAVPASYYIDATLHQIFSDYGIGAGLAKSAVTDALARERAAYERAARIACFSSYAARSVVEDYGLPASRVHVIAPGANLFEEQLQDLPGVPPAPPALRPLRLGFIGKDWRRKGLPFLLEVAQRLSRRQVPVEVVAVGPAANRLPPAPCLRPAGFIDKRSGQPALIALVRSWHFGCLFSSAEAYGISNLECLRLGVPVLARRVGGLAATVPEGLGHLFEPEAAPDEVADLLAGFVAAPERYWQLRASVAARAEEFSWRRTVERFIALWQGSATFSYERVARGDG